MKSHESGLDPAVSFPVKPVPFLVKILMFLLHLVDFKLWVQEAWHEMIPHTFIIHGKTHRAKSCSQTDSNPLKHRPWWIVRELHPSNRNTAWIQKTDILQQLTVLIPSLNDIGGQIRWWKARFQMCVESSLAATASTKGSFWFKAKKN